jgi:hypothetical protein
MEPHTTSAAVVESEPLVCHTSAMSEDNQPDPDDPREKFRQALDAKKAKGGHRGAEGGGESGGAKGSSQKAGGKREFRRKSG